MPHRAGRRGEGSDAGVRVGQSVGSGRSAGQDYLAQPVRGEIGSDLAPVARQTDPAPRPWWPGVRQQAAPATRRGVGHDPAPVAIVVRHSDGHDPAPCRCWRGYCRDPVPSGRHSDSTDPAPSAVSGEGYVSTRCPLWRHSGGHAAPRR